MKEARIPITPKVELALMEMIREEEDRKERHEARECSSYEMHLKVQEANLKDSESATAYRKWLQGPKNCRIEFIQAMLSSNSNLGTNEILTKVDNLVSRLFDDE